MRKNMKSKREKRYEEKTRKSMRTKRRNKLRRKGMEKENGVRE